MTRRRMTRQQARAHVLDYFAVLCATSIDADGFVEGVAFSDLEILEEEAKKVTSAMYDRAAAAKTSLRSPYAYYSADADDAY